MKHILGALLIIFMAPSAARGVDFDASLLSTCLALAETPHDKALQQQLLTHNHIKLLSDGLPSHATISFEQISKHKDRLSAHAAALPGLSRDLPQLASDAAQFLGPSAIPGDLSIRIVCGTPYDGFGFQRETKTQLFVNLALITPVFFPHLLRHEIWHVAFRAAHTSLAEEFEETPNPLKQLSFIMLNEGIGHYYSFRRRVEPEIVYDNWQERTDTLFALLHEKIPLLASADSPDQQKQLLWRSEAGVPFWKKWGATTGAVITYRLKEKLGIEGLKPLIAGGPCTFLTRYHKEAAQMPEWQTIPEELVSSACKTN